MTFFFLKQSPVQRHKHHSKQASVIASVHVNLHTGLGYTGDFKKEISSCSSCMPHTGFGWYN